MRKQNNDHWSEFYNRAGDIGDKLFVIEILAVFATILHFVLLVIYKNCFT